MRQFLSILDEGRIATAALSLGVAEACLEHSVAYAGARIAFGKPIGIAARIKKGQTIFQVDTDQNNLGLAKEALIRAATKLPCSCAIEILRNAA